MPVSEETYRRVALEDPESKWELHCGELRRKPGMTLEHNSVAWRIGFYLQQQLPFDRYEVRLDSGRATRSPGEAYIPDVMVIPVELMAAHRGRPVVEAYGEPLPLVVEVWSPSTGEYDVDEKLPEYRRRGDIEIWRVHPYERTITAWRRQVDGSYAESHHSGGTIEPASLPGVSIELASIFS
ncbi:MAG: Uma2 family endonuclease [Tepidiformaceae bacterium]